VLKIAAQNPALPVPKPSQLLSTGPTAFSLAGGNVSCIRSLHVINLYSYSITTSPWALHITLSHTKIGRDPKTIRNTGRSRERGKFRSSFSSVKYFHLPIGSYVRPTQPLQPLVYSVYVLNSRYVPYTRTPDADALASSHAWARNLAAVPQPPSLPLPLTHFFSAQHTLHPLRPSKLVDLVPFVHGHSGRG
jgi:hypothetical protein